jgi:hypothetical protein
VDASECAILARITLLEVRSWGAGLRILKKITPHEQAAVLFITLRGSPVNTGYSDIITTTIQVMGRIKKSLSGDFTQHLIIHTVKIKGFYRPYRYG